jgi:hypothetical protein
MRKDSDNPQEKLKRIARHLEEDGFHIKKEYCYEIIDYINNLELKIEYLEDLYESDRPK